MHRFVWARLNTYGLFIAFLCMVSGLSNMISPEDTDIYQRTGTISFALYVRAAMLVVGGLLILWGLLRTSVRAEICGLFSVLAAVVIGAWREAMVFGILDSEPVTAYVLVVLVSGLIALRVSTFLEKDGVAIVIPGSNDNGH